MANASVLNSISLAIGLMHNDPSAHDARLAWQDYAWETPAFEKCLDRDGAGLCHASHAKWDWKRDQWVDFYYGLDTKGTVDARLVLSNNDPKDADFVCVTALFIDAAGKAVFAFHQNWHVGPKSTRDQSMTYRVNAAALQSTRIVVVGSKQCRDGATEDEELFNSVKASIGQK